MLACTDTSSMEVGSRDQVMEAPVHPYTRELLYSYTHWEGGGET